jgi:hypothetical protein
MAARFIAIVSLWVLLATPWAVLAGDNDPIAGLAPGTPVALQRLAQMQPNDMVIIIGKIGRPWPDDFPASLLIVERNDIDVVTIVQGEMVRRRPFACATPHTTSCNDSLQWVPATDRPRKEPENPDLVDDLYWELETLWPLESVGTVCGGSPIGINAVTNDHLPGAPPVIYETSPIIVVWRGQVSGCITGEPHTYALQVNLHILRGDLDFRLGGI